MIQWESQRERRCAWLLEYSTAVLHYVQQPMVLEYSDENGKLRKTIPDYGVELRNGELYLVEVKKSTEMEKTAVKTAIAARSWAANRAGFHYEVVTDQILFESEAVKNVTDLLYCRPMTYELYDYLSMAGKHDLDRLTIRDADSVLGHANTMRILALQIVSTDLRNPISQDSVIRVAQEAGEDDLLIC